MKIMMLSWEYPPVNHGGLARHVQDLSEALVEKGHTVNIITQGENNIPQKEELNGVKIIRTENSLISGNSFLDNILHLNYQLLEKAVQVVQDFGEIDIIHGHDWLVFWASKVLKHSLKKPLIYTIHATEYGRNHGIYNDMQRYINDLEWYATYEAWKVIVCSKYMKNEVKGLFQVPNDKIFRIANGVNIENYLTRPESGFKEKYAHSDEKVVFYVGRIVREKGIQVLIQAIPEILHDEPGTKFVIAGKGPHLDNLKRQADYLGVADRIYFTGFISDEVRNKLYQVADAAVFPSLYEPFGIVALEAMATKTPVIVSNVGGLSEFVKNEKNGLKVEPNNPHKLAQKVKTVLSDKVLAEKISENGYKMVRDNFNWDKIAEETIDVYERVLEEYSESGWHKSTENTYIDNERKYAARFM